MRTYFDIESELSLCLKYRQLQKRYENLKRKCKHIEDTHYEFATQVNIDGEKRDVELYKISGLLKHYGYFEEGIPEMSESFYNENGEKIVSRTPIHLKRINLYKSLSKKLGMEYKKYNKKNIPIGIGIGEREYVKSRSNSYPDTPYLKEIVIKFMEKYPEEVWINPKTLLEQDKEKYDKAMKKKKDRVEKYLKTKKYLPKRIKNNKLLSDKKKLELQDRYNKIIEKCQTEQLKNKEMDVLFSNLRADLLNTSSQ